jgi:hypothetical protein
MTKGALIAIASTALMGASIPIVSGVTTFTVPLSGNAESNFVHPSGGTGDPDGTGSVRLSFDPAKKQLCYNFRLSGVSTPLMAHIHQGEPLRNGPPVVTLFTGPGANLDDCVVWLRGQLSQIVSNPAGFYVNVETTEFPDGALRGQLAGASSRLVPSGGPVEPKQRDSE